MAGFRVAQLVPGIGPATARRLLDAMDVAADPVAALTSFQPPAAAASEWASFVAAYRALRDGAAGWPAELDAVQRWYAPHLQRLHDDAAVRQADLAQLARIAAGYASRERFLTELTLDPPDATSDEAGPPGRDEDYLVLSTIHSAKGQEWTAVYVLNVVDGCIPSDMATGAAAEIEEERRLLYVAMTRARQQLQLVVPQRFYVTQQASTASRHVYGSLSRFIPPHVAALFERLQRDADTPCADVVAPAVPAVDIAARLRASWG
jgi:DNA helicase-2/ATP-dependent DNA helicase PcrA